MYGNQPGIGALLKLTSAETNHKNVPSTRSVLHVPTVVLPHIDLSRMGIRIRRWLHANATYYAGLHLRTLSSAVVGHSDAILLPGRSVAGAWKLHAAGPETRAVQLGRGRGQRRAGVWILLGCFNTRICTGVGIPLRGTVPVHASHRNEPLVSAWRPA